MSNKGRNHLVLGCETICPFGEVTKKVMSTGTSHVRAHTLEVFGIMSGKDSAVHTHTHKHISIHLYQVLISLVSMVTSSRHGNQRQTVEERLNSHDCPQFILDSLYSYTHTYLQTYTHKLVISRYSEHIPICVCVCTCRNGTL